MPVAAVVCVSVTSRCLNVRVSLLHESNSQVSFDQKSATMFPITDAFFKIVFCSLFCNSALSFGTILDGTVAADYF